MFVPSAKVGPPDLALGRDYISLPESNPISKQHLVLGSGSYFLGL